MASWLPSRQDAVPALLKLLWGSAVLDTPLSLYRVPAHRSGAPGLGALITGFVSIYILAILWVGQVTDTVPDPYLVC